MSELNQKKIALLKKVMALANDERANEGEREAAMRQAANIMQKYNLSLADLPADQQDEARGEQNVTISADTWARNLCQSVGSLFFCNYFYGRTGTAGKDHHYFVGRQSNVVTAMGMCEYLIKSIKKEASKRYKSPTSPEGRSFCVGAVRAIAARAAEQRKGDTAEMTPGTAVVLANQYQLENDANKAFMESAGRAVTSTKARTDNSLRASAFHAGKEHGKTVGLNTQLGTTAKVKRTLIGN